MNNILTSPLIEEQPKAVVQEPQIPRLALLRIFLQLGLIAAVIHIFQIEADLGLTRFWPLMCIAFGIHALAPRRYRPMVFFGSFVLTLVFFLGEYGAAKVLLIGGGLLGICHLPLSLNIRKLLVFAAGILLALMTLGYISSPISSYQMRIFATLFMFRIILYLYELNYEKKSVSIWHRLNYFFLLPNIIMPLFPIVDYQAYQKTYYNKQDQLIYQSGVDLILWSICCLLMYRGLYHFGIPSLLEIQGLGDVLHYITATYLTVIRLVGLLSLSVGILRLFGYNLPKIFNYMFFASSFADLFRRINIYWKDFLTKVCYYPLYFRLRKLTPAYALTLATLVTFFFTWFFHIYQWFWVLATNPLRESSIVYWGIFGVIATVNTFFEGKKRKTKSFNSLTFAFTHVAKVIGTFLMMSILYSLWVSLGLDNWMALIVIALTDDASSWIKYALVILTIWLIGGLVYYAYLNTWQKQTPALIADGRILRGLGIAFLGLFALIAYTQQDEHTQLGIFVKNEELNEKDNDEQFTGYYNEILKSRPDIASQLWGQKYKAVEEKETFAGLDIVRPANSVILNEFMPNSQSIYRGKRISTNRWGFRDRDYEKERPANTIRIAIVGASPTMGHGVHDEEVFEQLTEAKLNENFGSDSLKFELLNFAQASICAYQQAFLLDNKIRFFQPQYVLYIEHCRPFAGFFRKLERVIKGDRPLYPALDSLVKAENIMVNAPRLSDTEKQEKGKILANWGFRHFRVLCEQYDIQPIWMFLPGVSKADFLDEYLKVIAAAGFEDQINLKDIYKNHNQQSLQVAADDRHPNAAAHRLIADKLYEELVKYLELEEPIR